jgi:hypothetical protein
VQRTHKGWGTRRLWVFDEDEYQACSGPGSVHASTNAQVKVYRRGFYETAGVVKVFVFAFVFSLLAFLLLLLLLFLFVYLDSSRASIRTRLSCTELGA